MKLFSTMSQTVLVLLIFSKFQAMVRQTLFFYSDVALLWRNKFE